jgi:hypothetical protein
MRSLATDRHVREAGFSTERDENFSEANFRAPWSRDGRRETSSTDGGGVVVS